MNKNYLNFSFTRVRKNEVPEIMLAMLDIVVKHDPEAKKLVVMYNLLLELKPLLDILTLKYDGYPHSLELRNQRKLLNRLLSAILAQITAVEKGGIISSAQHAKLAVPFLKSYLKGITGNSPFVKTGKIDRLLSNLGNNTEMKAALEALGFTLLINELKVCYEKVNAFVDIRREALSGKSEFNTIEARAKIEFAIINLLNAINLAKVEHVDIDYMPLINELNVLLSSKRMIIKSRISRNNNSLAFKTTTVDSSSTTLSTAI